MCVCLFLLSFKPLCFSLAFVRNTMVSFTAYARQSNPGALMGAIIFLSMSGKQIIELILGVAMS